MNYHRVRSSVPEQAAGFAPVVLEAAERHRDGVSCQTTAAYTYDANGHKRWCIDCKTELGEEASWHPDGRDVPEWLIGAFIVLAALLAACLVVLFTLGPSDDDPGPVHTPTTYGPPTQGVR
jgi:hypothetical protein